MPDMTDEQKTELRPLAKALLEIFFLPPSPESDFYADLDAVITRLPAAFSDAAGAFRHNLQSVTWTVGIPFFLASASESQKRFDFMHMAERIRALPATDDLQTTESTERQALEEARRRMTDFVHSEDGVQVLSLGVCSFLVSVTENDAVRLAANELLRQGTVLVWGSLEVLVRDVFKAYLNANPSSAMKLLEDPTARRRFPFKTIPLETLAEHQFDVSREMGGILTDAHDLGDLGSIKVFLKNLFPDSEGLRQALDQRELWLLNQRRHVIVHRRGIVDAKYLENTGDQADTGTRIRISPRDFERYLEIVRDVGVKLLNALLEQ